MKKAEPKWPSSKQHKKQKNKCVCAPFNSTVGVFLSRAIREGVVYVCALAVAFSRIPIKIKRENKNEH